MKNHIVLLFLGILAVSCNKPAEPTIISTYQKESRKMDVASEPQDAETAMVNSDCSACHNLDERLVGPSYKEIAEKYADSPANIELLASKIINGGKGNWGDIPMTAHPDINPETAKAMVKYILAQK